MSESQTESTTWRGRALVLTVVAAVALTGVGVFVVGGSPTTTAGNVADWSPHPGKDVTPDNETVCPPANETSVENETGNDTRGDNATNASGYQLRIVYDGGWKGTIVTEDTDIPIEGTGNETIDIDAGEDERVAATVSKTDITNETMSIQLLLDGAIIDEQQPVGPDVDNFNSSAGSDSSSASETAGGSTTDTTSLNRTGTGNGWNTFGGENEASAFDNTSDDPFANDTTDTTTATASNDPFAGNSTVNDSAFGNTTNATNATNTTNATTGTDDLNDTATSEECVPEGNTTTPLQTNDSANGTALSLSTNGSAQVVFADQSTTGTSVVVESATVPDGGFVVIHNMSLLQDGDVRGSVVGVSDELDAQQSEDIEVTLAREVTESQTLIAVLYRDTDGDGEFEYDGTEGAADGPYLDDNGTAVADNAYVTVPGDEASVETADNNSTANVSSADTQATGPFSNDTSLSNASDDEANEAFTETNAPGFGIGVAVVAMLGAALLATRRF